MQITAKKLITATIVVVAVLAAIPIYNWLSFDPDKQAIKELLEKLADGVGEHESEDYLQYVNLEEFGFRLEYWGSKYAYGKGDRSKFLKKAASWIPMLKGSTASLVKIDIEKKNRTAEAKIVARWQKAKGARGMLDAANIGCNFELAKGEDKRWLLTGARLYPARELIFKRN